MTKRNISRIVAKARLAMLRKDPKTKRFFDMVTGELFQGQFRNRVRTAKAKAYVVGLLFARSKTVVGIADDLGLAEHTLRHFIHDAPWDAQEVLMAAARLALAAAERQGLKVIAWALDDTCQVKWGRESPGVASQWNNLHNKTMGCQSFPTLHLVFSDGRGVPVAASLYLPPAVWTSARAEEAGIPAALVGKTKPEIGLMLIDEVLAAGFPKLPVLADAAFGHSGVFRKSLEDRGLKYLVDINNNTSFYDAAAPTRGRSGASLAARVGKHQSAAAWLARDPWEERNGRKSKHRFLRPYGQTTRHLYYAQEPVALHVIAEKTKTKKATRYSASNLPIGEALALLGKRWAIEQNYRELKGLTGFAKFQGRSYDGLMRHLALSAVGHILLFWVTLYENGLTLYKACKHLPGSIRLALRRHCPTCDQALRGYG